MLGSFSGLRLLFQILVQKRVAAPDEAPLHAARHQRSVGVADDLVGKFLCFGGILLEHLLDAADGLIR